MRGAAGGERGAGRVEEEGEGRRKRKEEKETQCNQNENHHQGSGGNNINNYPDEEPTTSVDVANKFTYN